MPYDRRPLPEAVERAEAEYDAALAAVSDALDTAVKIARENGLEEADALADQLKDALSDLRFYRPDDFERRVAEKEEP